MNPLYPTVAERAGHRCEYCHAPETAFNTLFEVEHITPQALGGEDTTDNLALSCRSCNGFKSDRRFGIDPETQAMPPLYHPRYDNWDDHFLIEV
jgi:5-methylcytosine-specific restriction endonuclease McrA